MLRALSSLRSRPRRGGGLCGRQKILEDPHFDGGPLARLEGDSPAVGMDSNELYLTRHREARLLGLTAVNGDTPQQLSIVVAFLGPGEEQEALIGAPRQRVVRIIRLARVAKD